MSFSKPIIILILLPLALLACEAPQGDLSSGPEFTLRSICAQASDHVVACTGAGEGILGESCEVEDAELLLDTPCEVLQQAADLNLNPKADGPGGVTGGFACQWFGIGCPVDDSCAPTISEQTREELIWLSDPETLVDEYDARDRIEEIAHIFMVEPDPIGMFSIVYRHITNNAVQSVEDGMYEHPEWTRDLITAFARRYLVNLHGHLTGGQVTAQWKKYYKLARNCQVGRARVLGVAIATHLLVDLTYALHDVDSVDIHEEDYVLFGEVSLWVFPDLVADTQAYYDTDVSRLLQGFFFGDWVDAATKDGVATTFIYQTVRLNSWRNSQNLWNFPHWMVHADVRTGWGMGELALALLDASGAI